MKTWLAGLMARLLGEAGKLFARVMGDLRDQGAFDRAVVLAKTTVAGLAGDKGLSNDEKRRAAIDGLARVLAAEGLVVRDSLLALAVELAVSAGKAALSEAVPS